MVKPKVVLLIFVSGKIVLTGTASSDSPWTNPVGAKERADIFKAFDQIYDTLDVYKKQSVKDS